MQDMPANLMYLDTSTWNSLCDQAVGPGELLTTLSAANVQLALGVNVVYEMAKIFQVGTPQATHRGQLLFEYVLEFLKYRIPVVRETWQLLQQEAAHVAGLLPVVDLHWNDEEYGNLLEEVERLAVGVFDGRAGSFVTRRKASAKTARTNINNHLKLHHNVREGLAKIDDSALPQWLELALRSPAGRFVLQAHLADVFHQSLDTELIELADKLLANTQYKISHALVRDSLYLNWRCARRGSIRSDLPDDTYHGVNASYCAGFVTTENDQAKHALLANPHLRTVVYDKSITLEELLKQRI